MHLPEALRPALVEKLVSMTAIGGVLCLNNNQEWPEELAPSFERLTTSEGGFTSLQNHFTAGGSDEAPFAVTDAMAMILRRN